MRAVIDLGGDDRGALALGRYARLLQEEDSQEMLLVINPYRPLTRSLSALSDIRREIEAAGKTPFTGIVNNANLGGETTLADIEGSLGFAREASAALGLPVRMTAVPRHLLSGEADLTPLLSLSSEIFPVDIYRKSIWSI